MYKTRFKKRNHFRKNTRPHSNAKKQAPGWDKYINTVDSGNIEKNEYKRQMMQPLDKFTKAETKLLIIARFGMLECGTNFKGTLPELCPLCNQTDNESHRLNFCERWHQTNLFASQEKVKFDPISCELMPQN